MATTATMYRHNSSSNSNDNNSNDNNSNDNNNGTRRFVGSGKGVLERSFNDDVLSFNASQKMHVGHSP